MSQDRFINVTLESGSAKRSDLTEYHHGQSVGGSASGDLTISFDSTKITSLSLFKSALFAATQQASGMVKP